MLKINENVVVDMEKCANLKRMPQINVVNNLSKSNTSLPQVTLVKALDLDETRRAAKFSDNIRLTNF